jgi:hypothetical protein
MSLCCHCGEQAILYCTKCEDIFCAYCAELHCKVFSLDEGRMFFEANMVPIAERK